MQLLTSVFDQVGESHRPHFRPGLEGGSSDESQAGSRRTDTRTSIEHRRSAEGQVINSPIAGKETTLTSVPSVVVSHLICFLALCSGSFLGV